MAKRRIVFFGNCQALALCRFCERFLAPRIGDLTAVIDIAAYDVASARRALENADVIVEQVFEHPLEIDVAAEYPAGKLVRFPNVYAIFYWPYTNQRHPRNDEVGKGYDEGPYPNEMGDSFLNRLILDNVPAERALEIYLREDLSARADRLFELNAEMQRKRDMAAGVDIQSHIARHFRDDHLFRTSAHPNMRIFGLVANSVFGRLGYPAGMIEDALAAQRLSPFPRVALPVHPGVIRHFDLRFADAETRYPYFDEGDYSFAEYVLRYMRFEWNGALRDAFRLADGDPDPALARLEEAFRLSPRSAAAARMKCDLLVQKRDWAAAAAAARLAVSLDAEDIRNWLALSRAHRLGGELGLADEALQRATGIAPVDAEVSTEAAHLAAAHGLWPAAVAHAQRAVATEPGTAQFHASLSDFQVQAGDLDAAVASARQAAAMDPEVPAYSLALADRLDRSGQAEEAAALIRAVIAGGGDPHAYVRLAQVLTRADDLEGAVEAFRQAAALAPANVELRLALADALDRQGESAEAAAILAAVVAAGSREPHHHARLGHFLSRIGDFAGAETAIRQAVALAPGEADLRRVLVSILDRDGRYDEALATVREMTAAGMRDEDTFGWLGHLLARTGDLDGAEAAFRQAVATAPMQSRFRLALADTLDRQGRAEEALADIRALVADGVRDRHTLGRLGHLLACAGDFGGAVQAYRQAIEAAPDEAGFRYALAEMLDRDGRTAEAAAVLRSMAEKPGDDRQAYRRLGDLLARAGDLAGAEEAFRRAGGG